MIPRNTDRYLIPRSRRPDVDYGACAARREKPEIRVQTVVSHADEPIVLID